LSGHFIHKSFFVLTVHINDNFQGYLLTPLKTILLATTVIVLLSACSSETKQKTETAVDNETKQKTQTVIDDKIDAVNEAKKSVAAVAAKNDAAAEQISATVADAPSGSSLYAQKCASCHGKDAEKSALNASQIIAGWKSEKTQNALNGYKAGTFGGKMKAIMEGQSRPLSEAEITLIAEYISAL
jgi:cytochrome c553